MIALTSSASAQAAPSKSMARYTGHYRDQEFALRYVSDALPEKWEKHAPTIVETIWHESAKYSLNPWLVLAMVENESAFDPRAKGGVGELGLLQLRPETAAWIARITGLPWKGKKSLYDVKWNLTYGIHYLGWLKGHTSITSRYLSAYNMGLKALLRKLKRSGPPKEYAQKTQKFYRKIRVDYVAFLVSELSSSAKRGPAEGAAVFGPLPVGPLPAQPTPSSTSAAAAANEVYGPLPRG